MKQDGEGLNLSLTIDNTQKMLLRKFIDISIFAIQALILQTNRCFFQFISNLVNLYFLFFRIFKAQTLFWELTWPFILCTLNKLLEQGSATF